MTVLTAREVTQYWVDNGGPSDLAVAWAAVALGESGWNTDARSPVGATGLYQFMPGSWPIQCGPFSNATDPAVNSFAAVILSGGGRNFAPWDSAYRDIYISGRYSYLSWPEMGSVDYENIVRVAAELGPGYHARIVPAAQPGIAGTLPGAINWYQQAANSVMPAIRKRTWGYAAVASKLY